MTTLQGHLERITYRHETSPFTIAKVRVDETHRLVTVIGAMPGVQPGDFLHITGSWDTHPKYGQQFKVSAVKVIPVEPLEGYPQISHLRVHQRDRPPNGGKTPLPL